MIRYFYSILAIIVLLMLGTAIFANTSRDIGREPELDTKLISVWIIFYTNIERLKNKQDPLQYDPDLEKPAQWQAEYCAKTQKLEHVIDVKGMETPKDRMERFRGVCGNCGENLAVKFANNSEGVPVYIKKDNNGEYYDYGDKTIFWRNQRQMAYAIVDAWMKSAGHRKNILNPGFKWIGVGTFKGTYSKNISYYACQVFNGNGNLPDDFIKAEYRLNGFNLEKQKQKGGETYSIYYEGDMVPGIVEVIEDMELKSHKLDKNGNEYTFINSDGLKNLFFVLYDKKHDLLYPVITLK